jgi:hypothetical protein
MSITSYPNVMTFSGGVGSFPYYLQVSRGLVAGHKRVFKFGYNGDIDDSEETIWDVGGLYAYPASAVTMTATSSSGATDEDVEVTIQGVDASYNELSETVTLDALEPQQLLAVFYVCIVPLYLAARHLQVTSLLLTVALPTHMFRWLTNKH